MRINGWLILLGQVVILIGITAQTAKSQCSNLDFTYRSQACKGENILFNTPDNFNQYDWDFCSGDLEGTPTASIILNSNSTGYFHSIEFIEVNGLNFGFFLSRASNKLFRLDFGGDMLSQPTMVDLGGLGISLDSWRTIKIGREGNNFFGFLIGNNSLYRIAFGSSITSPPTNAEILFAGSPINNPIDLALVEEDGLKYLFVVNLANDRLVRFRLQTLNDPMSSIQQDAITISSVPVAGGITFAKECDRWYALVSSVATGRIFRVFFGNGLGDITPVISEVIFGFIMNSPAGISLVEDNGKYYAFVQSNGVGELYRIDFGSSISNISPVGLNLGNLNINAPFWGFSMHKNASQWLGFSVENSGTRISRIVFPNNCFSSVQNATENSIQVIAQNSGTFNVTLRAMNNLGNWTAVSKSIQVTGDVSPDISFTTQNICANNNVLFFPSSISPSIISYAWNFGDSNTSTSSNPTHQYAISGSKQIQLVVTASNNCQNIVLNTIKIYDAPSSFFTLPTGLICTNNEFTFPNNTVDNFDGNLTYQWFVDNNLEATLRDLKYAFASGGNQDIKLKTSIPGCSSELTQTLSNIQSGPTVDFDYVGQCENEVITFTNNSAGDISGYIWDFGNGQMSTAVNETQNYSPGNYIASLQTTGTNGCISSTNKSVTIYSAPQTDFALDLPPFSCAGTPSQFNDLTPSPIDSNLSSWSWSFGDTGTATAKSPTHTYSLAGAYDVSLATTTNFGCRATKIKTIQIAGSPIPDFTLSASCLSKPTLFTDASGANNKSWLWKIGGTSFAIQNPTHVFSAPGNFNVELIVTGKNECISVISKPIIIHVPPALDFSTENNCAPQTTLFKDNTVPNDDPVNSYAWDFAGQGSGTGPSTQFSFSSPGTYNVKLTTTNQSGCSYSLTKSTIIVAAPNADFSSSNESGPPPFAVQFTNASQHATSYQWKFNDPNNSTSVVESPSFTYTTLGDFSVDLTASNVQGCVDTKSKKIYVIVPSTEVELEQFTLLYDQVTGSVRPVLSIKNNSNYTINSMDVILDIAGNAIIKEKISVTVLPNAISSQILKYELLPGNSKLDYLCVELQLTDDRLSDETDLTDNSECISLEPNEILLPPYPNPVQDQLHFDWIAAAQSSVKVSVVTQMGQLAYQKDIDGVEVGLNQIVLDVSNMNSGFYMLIFESTGIRKTFPFVILN